MAITKHTLSNGMEVILEENHARPVISLNALVKVGSAFETDKEAGMTHVIEHMIFKGTPTYPVGEIARSIEAAGGDINAYTSYDQTVYFINMASRFSDKALAILCDAIKNPLFDPQELENEKEVILEEIRREQDDPARLVGELLFQESYVRHPYGRPIIGFPKTVKSFTHDDLMKFYRKWYTPHNIAFIVVGDFETKNMLAKLEKHFKDFKGPKPPANPADKLVEPKQKKPRLLIKEANIQNSHLAMAWHVPEIVHEEVPAIDVAAHILGGSDSSRLEQEVKEHKKLVHHISSYAYTPKDPGIFAVSGLMMDALVPKALEAILHEVNVIRNEAVQTSEISRAKINIRSGEVYERETVGGQSGKLAYFLATAGSHDFEKRYYQMLQDVHTDDVMTAARDYLSSDNLTVVLMVPHGSPWAKNKKKIMDIMTSSTKSKKKPQAAKSKLHQMKLKNGLTLVVAEDHRLPIVAINASAKGGLRFETKANNGVTTLMSRTMTKGTTNRDAVRIAKDTEKIAGQLQGFSGRNTCGLKSEFLSEHLHDGFELFSDVLTHPSWAKNEIANEKEFLLHSIRDQEDQLSLMAFLHFLETLYPKHPYGLRSLGTIKTVKKLTASDTSKLYKRIFSPKQMVMSVVGDVNPDEIKDLAEEYLGDLPKSVGKPPKLKVDPRPRKPITTEHPKKEKQQAHIVYGFQGTTISSDDRFAMTVLNNILAGQGGRLFLKLRDEMGLAYAVSSIHVEGVEPGYVAVYIGTEPGKVDTSIDGIRAQLDMITSKLVTKEEIDRAKQYIVGTYELELQRFAALANSYSLNELYGLGVEEVERYPKKIIEVTREDVLRIAKKYFILDAPVLSIIRPA